MGGGGRAPHDNNNNNNACYWTKGTYYNNNKGKVVPVHFSFTQHHAMNTCWGSGGIAPLFDLCTRRRRRITLEERYNNIKIFF
jgi:hypothetical protein